MSTWASADAIYGLSDEASKRSQSSLENNRHAFTINGLSGTLTVDTKTLVMNAAEELSFMRAGDKALEKRSLRKSNTATDLGKQLGKEYAEKDGKGVFLKPEKVADIYANCCVDIKDESSLEKGVEKFKLILENMRIPTCHDRFALMVALSNTDISTPKKNDFITKVIDTTLEEYYAANGAEIRAGFNTDSSVDEYSNIDSKKNLTQLYLDAVVKGSDLSEIYKNAIKIYGKTKVSRVLQYLVTAAGKDIDSIAPSSDALALRTTVVSLKKLQVLRTIESGCETAVKRMKNSLKPKIGSVEIFLSVLKLIDMKWPLPGSILSEYKHLVVDSPQATVWLHNELSAIVDSVPLSIFEEDRARNLLMDAINEARSMATQKEEQED